MGNQYLRNLTLSLIGQLRLTWHDLGTCEISSGAEQLYDERGEEVKVLLAKMRPETLGRIVAQGNGFREVGRTSLYEIRFAIYLDEYADGKSLLLELACMTVMAEMADLLADQFEKYAVGCDAGPF